MKPVAGGSLGTGRYEMRDTLLYFKLGQVLDEFIKNLGIEEDQKMEFVRRTTADLRKEFDLHEKTNIFTQSVRFLDAFKSEEYFKEISKLCKDSFNQLREVEMILAKDNPLNISPEDIENFKKQLASKKLTYKQMRELCNIIKYKYGQYKLRIDYTELQDAFESVDTVVGDALDGNIADRTKLRKKLGGESFIKRLRFLLALLARETVFKSQFAKYKDELEKVSFPRDTNANFVRLYSNMLQFTAGDERDRNILSKNITPFEMGHLNTMLKALENEIQYREYKSTQEIFKNIKI